MATNVVDLETPKVLALRDIKRSGLTEADFKKMRMRALTSDETWQATSKYKNKSLLIPYFDINGRETDFFRLRFLEPVRSFGRQKPLRYYQPPDTPARAYLPPHINWKKTFADAAVEVWITEGEKKAAALARHGVACIGLGGVWSWKSTKRRQPIIPEFLQMSLDKRRIVLCFDTDAEEKPDVEGALAMLGSTLELRGAEVYRVQLPLLEDSDKIGLDDFLVARGIKALQKLEPGRLSISAELFSLNDEMAVIENPSSVLVIKTGELIANATKLRDVIFADRRMTTVDAAGRLVDTSAVTQWLKWPSRRKHSGIVYEPGQPAVLDDGRYNVWKGWGVKPKRGKVGPFLEYLDYLFDGKTSERKWFTQWLAYPLQHPGVKLYSAVVFWSNDQGTGKTLMGETMGVIYGSNFGVVTETELHSEFNSWMSLKQFVLGEEVTGSERRAEMNRLKNLITGTTVDINKKYAVPITVRNCVNFMFASNEPDAFLLDAKDRRYFIHEVVGEKPDGMFFNQYASWMREEGAPFIFQYLLDFDLAGFEPHAPAPFTEAKREMVAVSGSEADYLIRELYENPDQFLRIGDSPVNRDLYTLAELIAALDPDGKKFRGSCIMLSRALRRHGHKHLGNVRTRRGVLKLWPVRNENHWHATSPKEIATHYDGSNNAQSDHKDRKKAGF